MFRFETSTHFEEYVSRYILGHTFSSTFSDDSGQIGKKTEILIFGRVIGPNSSDLCFAKELETYEIKSFCLTASAIHIAKRKHKSCFDAEDYAYNQMKNCYFFGVDKRLDKKLIFKYCFLIKATNLDFDNFKRSLNIRYSKTNNRWESQINFKKLLTCYNSKEVLYNGNRLCKTRQFS